MAVGVVTTANPAYFNTRYTEAYLTQPNFTGEVRARGLHVIGTLNFEGYTLQRGELNAGIYGEGYVDRRHPHTLVHEAIVGVVSPGFRGVRASLAAGKGFTPYGTDDPMMRPFVKYPVNHHHAQIIERVVTVGAIAIGDPASGRGAALEFGLFNGDEPVTPFSAPRWARFGDSRSARLTLKPRPELELQASRALVRSPGIVQGGAFDHTQSSASVRWADASPERLLRYLLVEVARTDEGDGDARVFRFGSALAEAAATYQGWSVVLRGERTERPESERLLDPFRTASGHIDFQIVGVTRWRIATVGVGSPSLSIPGLRGTRVAPFAEIARATADARRRPTLFEPREFYGGATQWSLSAGVRLHAGSMRDRMGRYGVLAPAWNRVAGHDRHGVMNHP